MQIEYLFYIILKQWRYMKLEATTVALAYKDGNCQS